MVTTCPTNQLQETNQKRAPKHVDIGKDFNDVSVVDYEDEYVRLNSQMQLVWETVMEEVPYKSSSSYKNVAVLLLSWDKDLDDMQVEEEVNDLERVFSNTFNYKVYNKRLTTVPNKTAQNQIDHHVAEFKWEEDGPNNLLIVYYAGHGKPGTDRPDHLELLGKSAPGKITDLEEMVVWNITEAALQGTQADVLEILDCCYAGNLGGSRGVGTRSFECLAATKAGATTKSPGEGSFTRALIWALEQLVKESGRSRRFTTLNLINTIRHRAPHFPRHQEPQLIERNDYPLPGRYISLSPLHKEGFNTDVTQDVEPSSLPSTEQAVLTLKFIFETRPSPDQIEKLGKDLNMIMVRNHFAVSRIAWGGLHRHVFGQVIQKLRTLGLRRRTKDSISAAMSAISGSSEPPESVVKSWHISTDPQDQLPLSEEMLRDAYHLGQMYESTRLGIASQSRMLLVSTLATLSIFPAKRRELIFLASLGVALWCILLF